MTGERLITFQMHRRKRFSWEQNSREMGDGFYLITEGKTHNQTWERASLEWCGTRKKLSLKSNFYLNIALFLLPQKKITFLTTLAFSSSAAASSLIMKSSGLFYSHNEKWSQKDTQLHATLLLKDIKQHTTERFFTNLALEGFFYAATQQETFECRLT